MIPARDRPADEVEITPAMERAGLEALLAFDLAHDPVCEIIKEVYRAMAHARPGS